jgi:hypothetical protein
MKKTKMVFFGLLACIIVSCGSISPSNTMYCGYELTEREYANFRNKVELQGSAYEADSLWQIYDQINDSIRTAMPDTVEFEIFLSLLNEDEVGIDIFVPRNKEFIEKIGCTIMNANYSGKMPVQRYMCLYTYTNPDGSGDIPLEVAIKRKNKHA